MVPEEQFGLTLEAEELVPEQRGLFRSRVVTEVLQQSQGALLPLEADKVIRRALAGWLRFKAESLAQQGLEAAWPSQVVRGDRQAAQAVLLPSRPETQLRAMGVASLLPQAMRVRPAMGAVSR